MMAMPPERGQTATVSATGSVKSRPYPWDHKTMSKGLIGEPHLTTDPSPHPAPAGRPAHRPLSVVVAAFEGMRPYQWLKNTLVFVPLMTGYPLGERDSLRVTTAVFFAFNFFASAIYLINDIRDVAADRLHPHKRLRPIASGRLPRSVALGLVPFLLAAGLAISLAVDVRVTGVLVFYAVLMV